MSAKEELLNTLRVLDKRWLISFEELWEVAKLYNVKAQIWKVGIPLKDIDKKVYEKIRRTAVGNMLQRRPASAIAGCTTDELCLEIERLIREGYCGLGKRTYMPRR